MDDCDPLTLQCVCMEWRRYENKGTLAHGSGNFRDGNDPCDNYQDDTVVGRCFCYLSSSSLNCQDS